MAEYIDKEKLLEDIERSVVFTVRPDKPSSINAELRGANKIIDRIRCAPAVDMVEVRHGEWVVSRTDFGWDGSEFPTHCKCILCGREVPYQYRDNYCPNCGAKMDGGVNDG